MRQRDRYDLFLLDQRYAGGKADLGPIGNADRRRNWPGRNRNMRAFFSDTGANSMGAIRQPSVSYRGGPMPGLLFIGTNERF